MATILVKDPNNEATKEFVFALQSQRRGYDMEVLTFDNYSEINPKENEIFIYDLKAEFPLPKRYLGMPSARTLYFTSTSIANELDTSELPDWIFIGKLDNNAEWDEIVSEYRRVTRNTHGWAGFIDFRKG